MVGVEVARLAVDARVVKVLATGVLGIPRIVALDVLPRIACVAIDRVAIVVRATTDTFDRVGLLVRRRRGRRAVQQGWNGLRTRLTWRRGRR